MGPCRAAAGSTLAVELLTVTTFGVPGCLRRALDAGKPGASNR